jgi:FkbM family methyltransferase
MSYHLFPFDKVPKNSRVVLYGAGNVGKQFYDQATETNFCEIVLWLDKNADGILIKQPETVTGLNVNDYDFAIIAIENESIMLDVKALLMNYRVPENKILHSIHVSSKFRKQIENKKQKTLDLILGLKPLQNRETPQYIVSLTSYKKRLTDTAPYAITTLFNQTIQPDRIVLWVANEDKEHIPQIMEKLVEKGLEIRFCEDIKSYKKLIPTLEAFPDDYIITGDDDVYYPENWFEQFIMEQKKNPNKIICHRAHGIKVDENHNLLPYEKWDNCIEPTEYFGKIFISQEQSKPRHQLQSIFPTGASGILYPPKCFYKDILNKELFMKLAPMADDIWYWTMAILNKEYFREESPYIVIENGYSKNLQDIEPEQQQNENALWNYNVSEKGNDKQLKVVIEYYPQIKEVLKKIDVYCFGILKPCGFVMKLDTNDWVQKAIYEYGCYEQKDVLALLSLMSQNGIFFDIGANVGVYSLNFSKKAKKVYSFEATEKTYNHLLETISMNKIKNIHHNFNAVHSESGIDIEIWQGERVLGSDNDGNNGMFNTDGKGSVMVNTVKSVAIDDFVRDNNIEQIDIMKIDIEGNELNALKGAKESILRFRPIILCEINPEMNEKAGYTSKELLDFFVCILNYVPKFFQQNMFSLANENRIINSQCNVFFFPK